MHKSYSLLHLFVVFCSLFSFVSCYDPPTSLWLLDVQAPTSMKGKVSLIPNSDLGQFIGKMTNATLALLNSAEDQSGCQEITTTHTDAGIPYTDVILLTTPSDCTTVLKIQNMHNLGVQGWIVPFGSTGALNNEFSGNPPIPGIPSNFWYYYAGFNDAMLLINYLKQNTTTNSITFNFAGSGPIFPTEKAAFLQLATSLVQGGYNSNCELMLCGNLIPLSTYVNEMPTIDPCIQRVEGIACALDSFGFGHIGTLAYSYYVDSDHFDWALINQFPLLIGLAIFHSPKFRGPIPNAFCTQPSFLGLMILQNNSITSLPDCFLGLTYLIYFDVSTNLLTSIPPSLTQKTYMQNLILFGNQLTSFTLNNPFWAPQLAALDVSNNQITSPLPNFSGFTNLRILHMQNNHFYSTGSIEHYFDGATQLGYLDLSNNNLHSPLPQFLHTPAMKFVFLGLNSFYGGIPNSWQSLSLILDISLEYNQLNGTILPVKNMSTLQYLDISNNQFTFSSGVAFIDFSRDLNQYFGYILPASLITLHADNNLFAPAFFTTRAPKWPFFSFTLATITLNGNGIKNFPFTLCNGWTTTIILSDNKLIGEIPFCPIAGNMQLIDITNNPGFGNGNYPPFAIKSDTFAASQDQRYFCPNLIVENNNRFQLKLDPSYYNYKGCVCNNGYFGQPPNCQLIPNAIPIGNSTSAVELNNSITVDKLLQNTVSPSLLTVNITDSTYGNRRYMPGMTTTFTAPLTSMVNFNLYPDAKVITLLFYVNRDTFNDETDVLQLFDGDQDTSNNILNLQGNELLSVLGLYPGVLNNTKHYNSSVTFAVNVVNMEAVLNYQTAKSNADQFTLEFYTSSNCPEFYYLPTNTSQCLAIPVCTAEDFSHTISSCNGDKRTVSYFITPGVVCRVTKKHPLPDDQTISCSALLYNNNVAIVLIILMVALVMIGSLPYIYSVYGKFKKLHGKSIEQARLKVQLLWTLTLMGSWILNFITLIVSVGAIDSIRCNIRVISIVISFFAAISAASVSQQAVVQEIKQERQQKIDKINGQLRFATFLIGGFAVELIILIVTSAATFSSFVEVVPMDYNGTVINDSICTLGSVPYIPIVLLGFNALIALWSFISMTPTWSEVLLDLDEKLNEIKSVVLVRIRDNQKIQMACATVIQLITILSTTFIVVFSYTDAAGIKNDNTSVSVMQMALLIVNVCLTMLVYYMPQLINYYRSKTSSDITVPKSKIAGANRYRRLQNNSNNNDDGSAQEFALCQPLNRMQGKHLKLKDNQEAIPGVNSVIELNNCKSMVLDCMNIPIRVQDPILLSDEGLIQISDCNNVLVKNVNIVQGSKVQLSITNSNNIYIENFQLFRWFANAIRIDKSKNVHFIGEKNKIHLPLSLSPASAWTFTYLYYLTNLAPTNSLANVYIDLIHRNQVDIPDHALPMNAIVSCKDSEQINFHMLLDGMDHQKPISKLIILQQNEEEIAYCHFEPEDVYLQVQGTNTASFQPKSWVKIHSLILLNYFANKLDSGSTQILTAIQKNDGVAFSKLTQIVERNPSLSGFKLLRCSNVNFHRGTEIQNLFGFEDETISAIEAENSSEISANQVQVTNLHSAGGNGALYAYSDLTHANLSITVSPQSTKVFSL